MPNVLITLKTKETMTLELYEKDAPKTVENFMSLVGKGFYDRLTFHRVISGFMVQGGCPVGNGTGGPGYSIEGEFSSNGFNNPINHTRGVISMARSSNPNSAGSQFFIMHKDAPHLDGSYAAFGRVIEGIEVIDMIARRNTDSFDKPLEPVVIESIVSL